jgi:hypothetical protein
VLFGSIALHRFEPEFWPPLAVSIMHSLHGPGFAVVALLVFWALRLRYPSRLNYLPAFAVTMGIGVISEIAQIPGPREAQLSDLVVDALGILGALGVLAAFDRSVRTQLARPVRLALPALAGLALGIACVPTLWFSYALVQQQLAFPQLLTFEERWERAAFDQTDKTRPSLVAAPANWPVAGNTVARAQENGRWGIFIGLRPQPDWRGYSSLSFVVASVSGRFAIDIGVRDMAKADERHGVRYYKTVWADEKPQQVTVTFDEIAAHPGERAFDFSLVQAVVLSASEPGQGSEILVDDFRLNR